MKRSLRLVVLALAAAAAAANSSTGTILNTLQPQRRPPSIQQREKAVDSCPLLHIIAARETTAPPGFGSAQTLVDLVTGAISGAGTTTITAEAIDYPAAGGEGYAGSVTVGVAAVVRQTAEFAARCPRSAIIMHGYSQGAQIIDDAFCGGPDFPSLNSSVPLVTLAVARNVLAIVLMGNPRHVPGLVFNAGNATAGGFAARPRDFRCPVFEDRIQAYCDDPDPFCSNSTDDATHESYGQVYGKQALGFVISRLII